MQTETLSAMAAAAAGRPRRHGLLHGLIASGFLGAAGLTICASQARAAGDDPISAIDWLSQSVSTPGATGKATGAGGKSIPPVKTVEPPVASDGALPVLISSTPLDAPLPDTVGLIAPAVSGLPHNLWGAGLSDEIARAVIRDRMESLPALRQLFLTMLLAEADPPIDGGTAGLLLQARIDKLLMIGALEQAAALIDIAGDSTPEFFRRAFDIAILTGREDKACERMQKAPGLAPTLPARVFCLARSGDWDAAALTLTSAEALGDVDKDQAALLSRFLDPDLFEADTVPPPPNPVTPLDWKLYEAIGETIPTGRLPIAFAYAEIGPQSGWKAQIEAAERLTRAGTIAPNVLLGLYTERDPAASGGVWDRVRAFQSFDAAMQSGDVTRIAAALPAAWARMQEAELEVPFAFLYGATLAEQELPPDAAKIAFRVGLLSPQFETIARAHKPLDETETFLAGLALGQIADLRAPDAMGRAIAPAFLAPELSDEGRMLLEGMRLGEALLLAIEDIQRGVEGNAHGVTRGLSLLRKVKLENVARRTALELMILERRG